ncbi:glycosyltransferase family 4 protein [Verrucomicrobiota bacterium sgz303538]
MKIGLVRRGYSPTGGAEAYLKRFAQAATALGHECVLFATHDWPKGEWPHAFKKIKHGRSPLEFALELVTSDPKRECDVLFSLERVLECDCYRAGDGVHAAWLQRRSKYEPAWKTWWRNRRDKHHEILKLEETMFRGEAARVVIANSQMVKDEIVKHFGYPAEQIHVIYNGVPAALSPEDAAQARIEVRKELGLQETDYVVLFAGSGWERKGLRFAVEAMNEAMVENATLLVAGSGKPRQMPKSQKTRYLGPVRGLSRYLAAADVFILPTLYDPFSNACLEAMSAGLPVITSQANGFAEVIERGVEGDVLTEPADVRALAQAIERWAAPELRTLVRERLREKGTQFSMEKNVRETLVILEKLRPPVTVVAESV